MQSRLPDVSNFTTTMNYAVHWAKVIPHQEAFVFRRQDGTRYPLTWSHYLHLGTRFASRLQKMGIVKGDVIGNYLVNSPERVVTDLGTMLAGAVPMHGETLFADKADVTEILKKAKVRAVILDPDHNKGVWEVCQPLFNLEQDGSRKTFSESDQVIIIHSRRDNQGKLLLLEDLQASPDVFTPVAVGGDDFGYIIPTSGSTGFSKLVLHSHHNLFLFAKFSLETGFTMSGCRLFTDFSFGWGPGSIFLTIPAGITRVATDFRSGHPHDYPAFIWNCVVEEDCQIASLVTSHIHDVYQRKELWQDKGFVLDALTTGGQVIHRGTLDAIGSETGFARQLCQTYGLSETFLFSTLTFESASQFEEYLVADKLYYPVKIVDDKMKTVPTGSKGEVLLKTPTAFKGYLGDPDKDNTVFTDDGWIRTNDLGYLDDRGRLFVLGRRSDAIMKGLCVVFPSWLETRIRQYPGVADVVVVPVPDEVLHHEICACVVRKLGYDLTESTLDQFCQNLFVSDLDDTEKFNPKYFLFFDSFPLNVNYKIDRKRIRAMAAEMLAQTKL